jgi:hypothetical protein
VLSEGFQNAGRAPFWVSLTRDFIPDQDFIDSLSPIENLLMVGYPLGLRDEPSNSPIFRRGITATPYSRDFQRRPEFLTDLAALPGSSGSPVFIADFGGYLDKNFRFNVGQSRLRLLGVHSAGHRHQVRVQDAPRTDDDNAAAPSVWLPAHLGYCIKATELIWFERHLADFMAQTPPLAFRTTEEERAGEAG